MLKTVEAVKKRERELQFKPKSNSKKRSSRTILCKQQSFVGQSGERVSSKKLNFICCAQNKVLVDIRKIDFIKNIKDGLYSNIKKCYIVCPFCV